MTLTVAYHSSSTTFGVRQVYYKDFEQVYNLSTEGVATRHLIILRQSSLTKFTDSPSNVWHPTPTSVKIPMQWVYLKRCVQKQAY